MVMRYYKRYLLIGAAVLLTLFFLIELEESHQSFPDYYIVLYNRTYFVLLYLLVFLIGMVPIASKMLVPEVVIRYSGKLTLALSLHKKGFFYSIYYAGIFTAANMVLLLNNPVATVPYSMFTLLFFILQVIGWFFAGSVFLVLYALLKNPVLAYLAEMLIFITFTSLAATDMFRPVRYLMSLHEFMYLFSEHSNMAVLVMYSTHYCLLSAACIWAVYVILRKRDLLFQAKGG